MTKENIIYVKSRFMAGFSPLSQLLGVSPGVLFREGQVEVVYHLPAGKLGFQLHLEKDVEPFTQNLLSYTGSWVPVVQFNEAVIGGQSLSELSARIEDLRYAADPISNQHRGEISAIQTTITEMAGMVKKEQLPAFELFAARYYPQFDFGMKNVPEIRRQYVSRATVSATFSLNGENRVLPLDAWLLLQKPADKKRKR